MSLQQAVSDLEPLIGALERSVRLPARSCCRAGRCDLCEAPACGCPCHQTGDNPSPKCRKGHHLGCHEDRCTCRCHRERAMQLPAGHPARLLTAYEDLEESMNHVPHAVSTPPERASVSPGEAAAPPTTLTTPRATPPALGTAGPSARGASFAVGSPGWLERFGDEAAEWLSQLKAMERSIEQSLVNCRAALKGHEHDLAELRTIIAGLEALPGFTFRRQTP